MPDCGSQIILCDLPIRFDTYKGCTHNCAYCFAKKKTDIGKVSIKETDKALIRFIVGKRDALSKWCDWKIPLHWGGLSDPFQPAEKKYRVSYKCLQVFKETQYPFIVSTKGKLVADKVYSDLISACNCVVQISMACSEYDKMETGAPTFKERLQMVSVIAKHTRVNARIQPYMIESHLSICESVKQMAQAGCYGIIVEGMKFNKMHEGLVKIGADFCYEKEELEKRFLELRDIAHSQGMKFYSGENRLRTMGDSLTCCGIDGMKGFKGNTFNLNHILNNDKTRPTKAMSKIGSGEVFKAYEQTGDAAAYYRSSVFKEEMINRYKKNPMAIEKVFGKVRV